MTDTIASTSFSPQGLLGVLSKSEIAELLDSRNTGLYNTFRQCALAVLNCGSESDDGKALMVQYADFDIRITQQERGLRVFLHNAPASAFVDGEIIQGIREHLGTVIRDLLYASDILTQFDLSDSDATTDAVFHLLRNAGVLKAHIDPSIVVCWGGHSIAAEEYEYSKEVGYEMGLRNLNVCTGCGPGAMKGPMKGATIGHAKQRMGPGRYIGISEPGIIAAESPNPIVNELVIMPDIEKRLEAFVRFGHGIVVFPGGAGTMEEILYLLGILLNPDNSGQPFPLVFSGPAGSANYFNAIDEFIGVTLGEEAQKRYKIIVDDPAAVAREMLSGMERVKQFRREQEDAYHFNWMLKIEQDFQQPFPADHASMAALQLNNDRPVHALAADLRRAFSGIVAGNVKESGIKAVEAHGPFELHGDDSVIRPLDTLLERFVHEQRMKLPGSVYTPCYRIVR